MDVSQSVMASGHSNNILIEPVESSATSTVAVHGGVPMTGGECGPVDPVALLTANGDKNCSTMYDATATATTATGSVGTELDVQSTMQPDADTIKMFVGQVPRNWDEKDLLTLFSQFGPVYQLNVLRERATGQSRGCCFVTFYHRKDAVVAQCTLHNVKTLPGMHHPVQMKPADTENRNERKLFVGMISKKLTEDDVRALLSPYGTIEDCTVLRDHNGMSKGCAFVTFASRSYALNAIKAVNHSQTMEGCAVPIVVKFADTPKEKEQKKVQQQYGVFGLPSTAAVGSVSVPVPQSDSLNSSYLTPGLTAAGNLSWQQLAFLAAAVQNNPSLAALNGLGSLGSYPTTTPISGVPTASPANYSNLAAFANALAAMSCANQTALLNRKPNAVGGSLVSSQLNNNLIQLTGSPSTKIPVSLCEFTNSSTAGDLDMLAQAYNGVQQYSSALTRSYGQSVSLTNAVGKQQEGPEGANLFIYHLPQEFSDSDLVQTFSPFGNVISAKVFVDKQTKLSKCFGFVSFDNPISAQTAIKAMNGFQIGTKRLKVQLKRSKHEAKPYQHPQQYGSAPVSTSLS